MKTIDETYRWIKGLISQKSWTRKIAGVFLLTGLIIIAIVVFFVILILAVFMTLGCVAFLNALFGKK